MSRGGRMESLAGSARGAARLRATGMARATAWHTEWRRRTPGVSSVVHLNNAGASLPSENTLSAVQSFTMLEALHGGYEAAELQSDALQRCYGALGALLNCAPGQIGVTCSATHAWSMVVYGMPWQPGQVVLTSVHEYGSNYIAYLQLAKRFGIEIEASGLRRRLLKTAAGLYLARAPTPCAWRPVSLPDRRCLINVSAGDHPTPRSCAQVDIVSPSLSTVRLHLCLC